MAEPLTDRQCVALAAQAIHRLTCTASRTAAACDGPVSRDFELARELAAIISAAERERICQLATDYGAVFPGEPEPCGCEREDCMAVRTTWLPFADLIREVPGNG